MAKSQVVDQRFDFRGGRNTAISPDLLNVNELVDCTNARLSSTYGGFAKRTGTQRIHSTAFPGPVKGVTQWDTPSGKQVVVVSNGSLWWRNGYDFAAAFIQVTPTGAVGRTTANQGSTAGWIDPDGVDNGINSLSVAVNTSSTVLAANRLLNKLGDPAIDNNVDAVDDLYTVTFKVTADGTGLTGSGGPPNFATVTSTVTLEYSTDNGVSYNPLTGSYIATAGPGTVHTTKFSPIVTIPGAPVHVWIRLILTVRNVSAGVVGNSVGSVQIFDTVYKTDNFPITWTSGANLLSTNQPSFFAPFRASAAGAPLVLYIASGGHYFSWDGVGTLTQLDPANNAPLATNIISYHTRMFAMSASALTPGLLPKTIFWSVIGDPTDFRTGDKSKGGSAVTDFLTGQQLTALEVIGSSLLMATTDSTMRFTGHASDDIVISQDTEGISAEVGAVGPQALKRFENVAAMFSDRGPYVVTETYAEPSGEQLNPDWQALDSANLSKTVVEYNRNRKELLFAVPGAGDGGTPKTIFSQSVRLQAWQGPWVYPFDILCMSKYFDSNGLPNVLAGSSDGFVRLMDVGNLDDVLFDGTGGSNIALVVEIPVIHFGMPGLKKALKWLILQANLPLTSTLNVNIYFDGSVATTTLVTPNDNGEEDYRVDIAGDTAQGFRCRLQFIESSNQPITINGFTLIGWNYGRTT